MSYIIGIAGGSGSGKSTFAKKLKDAFPDRISLISCDNYYLPHDDISIEERKNLNYDSPDAFEFSLMKKHLESLKDGKDIVCPVYDFSLHTRSKKTLPVKASPIIIIDGILILSDPALRSLMDLKIFVETDADERILRRVQRDTCERGRDLMGIIEQYLTTVKPMHNAFVEPCKSYADIIINGGKNPVSYDIIKTKIENLLQK